MENGNFRYKKIAETRISKGAGKAWTIITYLHSNMNTIYHYYQLGLNDPMFSEKEDALLKTLPATLSGCQWNNRKVCTKIIKAIKESEAYSFEWQKLCY